MALKFYLPRKKHAFVRHNITMLDVGILFRENKTKSIRNFPFSSVWAQKVIPIRHNSSSYYFIDIPAYFGSI